MEGPPPVCGNPTHPMCLNGGTCVDTGYGRFFCLCTANKFTGIRCKNSEYLSSYTINQLTTGHHENYFTKMLFN